MSRFTQSNEEAILAEISGELARMGRKLKLELGAAEDARRGAPPRVTWVPREGAPRRYAHPAQQRAEGKVAHEKGVSFDVHFWGADYRSASALEDDVIAALYNRFSQNAYELGDGVPGPIPETPNEATGYEIITPIRLLRIPIFAELFATVTLETTTAKGQVVGALGEDPASDVTDIEREHP